MNALKKFFTSDRSLQWNLILAGVLALISFDLSVNEGSFVPTVSLHIEQILIVCLLLVTEIAYFKHDKNIMKCTMGALLSMVISRWLSTFSIDGFTVNNVIPFVLSLAIFITHLIINGDHHSSPKMILVNQIFCGLYMVFCLYGFVYTLICDGDTNLSLAAFYLLLLLCLNAIVIIESKLDAYRIAREANGWTEKK